MTSRMGVSEARGCRGTLVLNGPGLEAYKDASSVCLKQSVRWAFKELCGIDTQDQVMDQMKNIHFNFKKTCLLCDFDDFGPESVPYKALGQDVSSCWRNIKFGWACSWHQLCRRLPSCVERRWSKDLLSSMMSKPSIGTRKLSSRRPSTQFGVKSS